MDLARQAHGAPSFAVRLGRGTSSLVGVLGIQHADLVLITIIWCLCAVE